MKYTDIAKQSMSELETLILKTREELRAERFKDRFSRKASIIRQAKLTIARALTEINGREKSGDIK